MDTRVFSGGLFTRYHKEMLPGGGFNCSPTHEVCEQTSFDAHVRASDKMEAYRKISKIVPKYLHRDPADSSWTKDYVLIVYDDENNYRPVTGSAGWFEYI